MDGQRGKEWMKGVDGGLNETKYSWMNKWVKAVISSHPWRDPCHVPRWARHFRPSAPCGLCLWGFDLFDPSGLSGPFGPFCLYLQYQRRRDQSLCLSLSQGLCLYWPEEKLFDKGVPPQGCVKGHCRQ